MFRIDLGGIFTRMPCNLIVIGFRTAGGRYLEGDAGVTVNGLDVAVNKSCQLGFGEGAHLGSGNIAVLEQHQRRYAAYAEFCWCLLVFVDIEFRNGQATSVFLGNFIQYRRDHAAWTTPFRPVVYEDGQGCLNYLGIEGGVGNVMYVFTHGMFSLFGG